MSNARKRGFTLIELMVVIVILGTLAALVGPNIFGHLLRSSRKTTEVQITNFRNAIEAYYVEKRVLPQSLQDLEAVDPATGEPWLRPIPLDPWGQPYEYRVVNAAKREYEISSAGNDRQGGSDDDVEWTSTAGFRSR